MTTQCALFAYILLPSYTFVLGINKLIYGYQNTTKGCLLQKKKKISIDYEILTVRTKVNWGHLKEHHISYITAIPKRSRKKKNQNRRAGQKSG